MSSSRGRRNDPVAFLARVQAVDGGEISFAKEAASAALTRTPTPGAVQVLLDRLREIPKDPCEEFDPSELDDLAASVIDRGQLQALRVCPGPARAGAYIVGAGSRRLLAARRHPYPRSRLCHRR